MVEILTLALALTASPFALVGYIALGVYATTTWRAFKYAIMWGLTIQIFSLALGNTSFLDLGDLAVKTGVRLVGALVVTMGVFYLYRALRGGRGSGPGPDQTPREDRKTPHLRRVK
ncbi:MAG: hypothetical protein JJ899_01485 [Alphaproteobacteria bacterium]|nr:hypothetical protein [Alphaproteobacteria bacterium]